MLAYSGISHRGFVLLGFLAGKNGFHDFQSVSGLGASFYYVIVYAITTLAGFGVILAMSHSGFEADQLDDLKGLNQRNPWLAFLLLLVMFSLAGIPPLVGFYAKLFIITSLIQSGGSLLLPLLVVLFSLIGAFYYLRVVKLIYVSTAYCFELKRVGIVGVGDVPTILAQYGEQCCAEIIGLLKWGFGHLFCFCWRWGLHRFLF
jgi:NADH-quinone oxidoreductase subunit N